MNLRSINSLIRDRIEFGDRGYFALHRALLRRLRDAGEAEHAQAR